MVPSSFFCKNSIRCKRYTWPSYVGSAYLNYQALFPWHIDIHKNQSTEYVWIWASEASASMLGTGSNCFLDMKMKGETQLCWLQATAHPPPPTPSFPSIFYICTPDSWNQYAHLISYLQHAYAYWRKSRLFKWYFCWDISSPVLLL